ncbi:MAG: thiolase family protein [Ilumatobacter sp.]|uniref:thiolase family protein n=1 Tax=Ilumatobacter sp. TaxID=1967498 RepID=UPI00329A06AA
MREAVVVDAVRTPFGRRSGSLSHWHPVDLVAETLTALVDRTGIDPAVIDDVIMGCVMQVGEQGTNVARNAVLAADWPESIPGTTVDRQCGSSQQAIHFAAQGVMAGAYDVVIASGVEVMTRVPMGASTADGRYGFPFGPSVSSRYADRGGLVPQGESAEMIADRWGITRVEMDEYGLRSQERAARAVAEGRFDNEIIAVSGDDGDAVTRDGGIRATTADALARLQPAFRSAHQGGRVTAGNSSQITDGAASVLIMSAERAERLGVTPRARFVDFAVVGDDPQLMLTATVPATRRVLARAGLGLADIDRFEVNEAFASAVIAWIREVGPNDPDLIERVNVNGGAIALGHPLGASGTRLIATLVNELERVDGRYGLQVMCEGGGMANALILERC